MDDDNSFSALETIPVIRFSVFISMSLKKAEPVSPSLTDNLPVSFSLSTIFSRISSFKQFSISLSSIGLEKRSLKIEYNIDGVYLPSPSIIIDNMDFSSISRFPPLVLCELNSNALRSIEVSMRLSLYKLF